MRTTKTEGVGKISNSTAFSAKIFIQSQFFQFLRSEDTKSSNIHTNHPYKYWITVSPYVERNSPLSRCVFQPGKNVSFYYKMAGKRGYAKYTRQPAACEANVHSMHPECFRTEASYRATRLYPHTRVLAKKDRFHLCRRSWEIGSGRIDLRSFDNTSPIDLNLLPECFGAHQPSRVCF